MKCPADKQVQNARRNAARLSDDKRRLPSALGFADNRSDTQAQKTLRGVADNSPGVRRQKALNEMANSHDGRIPAKRANGAAMGAATTVQRASIDSLKSYGNFVDMGNGEFGTTQPTDLHEVAGLVDTIRATTAATGKHQNIKVLTGTHGDSSGNLYGEGQFYTEDLAHEGHKKGEGGWINVMNVKGKSKDTIRGWMTPGSSAIVLAWCYSKSSEENWASVNADWAKF